MKCGHEDEQGIAHERDAHAAARIVRQQSFAQGAPTLQARDDESDGAEHEIGARAPRDA